MNVSAIKRAPRWAWYSVAGIGLGAGAVKLWKSRDASSLTTDTTTTDTTTNGTTTGTPTYAGSGASPGVIVPPVILSNPNTDQSGTGLGDLQNLYMGGVQNLIDAYSTMYAPVANIEAGLLQSQSDTLGQLALAQAGPAPTPAAQAPTVYVNVPMPTPAPRPTPTPAAPRPAAPAPCSGEYPNVGPHGCYKVVCSNGRGSHAKGHWHFYKSGLELHVDNNC